MDSSAFSRSSSAPRPAFDRLQAEPAAARAASLEEALELAAATLRAAEVVTVLTGAGMSADSGVPTFRDAQAGWWARYRPEELATPEAFEREPSRVWAWYAMRRALVRAAAPHDGHAALGTLIDRVPRCTTVTQNVDGLHEAAGHPDVIRLHGSLLHVRCSAGCSPAFAAPPAMDLPPDVADPMAEPPDTPPPPCDGCGAPLRPDVVWFGEPLPLHALETARAAAIACDVFVSIGTSHLVEPAASLPRIAASHGATVVVVDPRPDLQLRGPSIVAVPGTAAQLLPLLVHRAWPRKRRR